MFHHGSIKALHLFNYMIGNNDYSITGMKNVKIFRKGSILIPVPYDFDFSGLVDAPYAIPNPDYQLTSMQERIYLGSPESIFQLHATKTFFYSKEKKFFQLIQQMNLLGREEKAATTSYLQSFYYNINQIDLPIKNRHFYSGK